MNVSIPVKALTGILKAVRLLEQARAGFPAERREIPKRGFQFDSERGRGAVRKRWQKSSREKALRKLGGEA
jgi:hypothetical protein